MSTEAEKGTRASQREAVFRYVRKKYKSEIEYLWLRFPGYAVFRHADNRKWYGIVMDIPRSRLGLDGEGPVDVLNVKLDDPLLPDLLIRQPGFFPGYHLNKGNWISILLDGTVPFAELRQWIDRSYRATASAATLKALRPPKEWIIPSNPRYYDIVHAFDTADEIGWKQGAGIKKGDTVFLYVGAPVSAILYKCVVTQTDIPYQFRREGLSIRALMRIRLLRRYDPQRFPFETLSRDYGVRAVRGPRGIPEHLSEALNR